MSQHFKIQPLCLGGVGSASRNSRRSRSKHIKIVLGKSESLLLWEELWMLSNAKFVQWHLGCIAVVQYTYFLNPCWSRVWGVSSTDFQLKPL